MCVHPNHPIKCLVGWNYNSQTRLGYSRLVEMPQHVSFVTLTNAVVWQHPFLEMAEPRPTLTALILAAKEAMRNHR